MQGGRAHRFAATAEALAVLGPVSAPDFARRVEAAGIGQVTVGPAGSVSWTDAAYRWHGRPRWRRVRTVLDAVQDVAQGEVELRAAYQRLASGVDPGGDELQFVVVDEFDVARTVNLLLVGRGTALVSGAVPEGHLVAPAGQPPVEPRVEPPVEPRVELQATPEPMVESPAGPASEPSTMVDDEARRRPDPPLDAEAVVSAEPVRVEPGPELPPSAAEPGDAADAGAATESGSAAEPGSVLPAETGREPLAKAPPEPELPLEVVEAGLVAEADPSPPPVDDSWLDLFDASPVPMAMLDDSGVPVEVNDALCRFSGRSAAELTSMPLDELFDTGAEHSAGDEGEDLRLVLADGSVRWARAARSEVVLSSTRLQLLTLEDVTGARVTYDQLRQQALYDELTGLPNRRLLVEQLAQALSRARRTAGKVGVFFIDVDDLKRVNDTHGHGGGDLLIRTVGQSVRDALRESDTLARIGGDEFVAVCEDVGEGRTLDEVGQRIIGSVANPLVLDGDSIPVSISVGVAVPVSADEDAETLLARADAAMYRAKAAGGGRLWGGTGRWNTAPDNRPTIQEWLDAMAAGQLRLMYEPVVTADDGILLGVVGKLRWNHAEHGELTGTDLLETRDVGSATGALVRWSVRRALAEVRSLNDSPLTVWLTVPSRALLQASVADEIATAYRDLGGRRAPSLVLDIREKDLASLLRRGGPPGQLARFAAAGPVALGIDGFRGDSVPLGLLPQLAPRSIRLHSALMRAAARIEDPTGRALLDGIVAAATAAGVTSIAAQVDDLDTLQVARDAHVLAVQGSLVAPARTIDGLAAVLHSRRVSLPNTHGLRPTTVLDDAVDLTTDIGASLAAETGVELPGEPSYDAPPDPSWG